MRRLENALMIAVLALGPMVASTACKTEGAAGSNEPGQEGPKRPPQLPKPLSLPKSPPMAAHIGAPSELAAAIDVFSPESITLERLAREVVAGMQLPAFEAEVAPRVAGDRPWNAARVGNENILSLPIRTAEVEALTIHLSGYPKAEKFGAVELPLPEGVTEEQAKGVRRLAWLDPSAAQLTIAGSAAGIATGYELDDAYGKHALFFTIDQSGAQGIGTELPAKRVTLEGEGAHAFKLVANEVDADGLRMLAELDDGALTGLLEAPQVALGASTRWSGHQEAVKSVISNLTRQVKQQNFLIRGVLEDLLKRLNSMLRAWNGRVLAAVGPSNHVLLSLGASDVKKGERAVLHLLGGVIDNLKLAKTFGLPVPSVRLKKNVKSAAEAKVHLLTLSKAGDMLPPVARPLLDDKGRLRIAMAFPKRAGGTMLAIGARAEDELVRWLEDSKTAPSASDSAGDLLSARIAVKPETLAPALQTPDGSGLLALAADREPTKVLLRRREADVELTVRGPKLEPPPKPIKAVVKPATGP